VKFIKKKYILLFSEKAGLNYCQKIAFKFHLKKWQSFIKFLEIAKRSKPGVD
jgi:hypothetical protein